MKPPAYEFVTICGWCGVELDRQPSERKTTGISHGVCERCYHAILRPQIRAFRVTSRRLAKRRRAPGTR